MEKARLLEAVKALNLAVYEDETKEAKVPIIAVKVKAVGVKDEDLKKNFIEKCLGIPEELEQFVPDLVGEVFNELQEEKKEAAPDDEQKKPDPGAKKDKKGGKEKKEKKEKEEKEKKLKNEFNRTKGSMADEIDMMLVAGSTKEAVVAMLMKKFGRTEDVATGRYKSHTKTLVKEGHKITEKDGVFTLTVGK